MAAYSKLASAIYNDIVGGLRGYVHNPTLSLELLEDEIVDERLATIKAYMLKGLVPKLDLLRTINCIPVDCKEIENCTMCKSDAYEGTPTMHFEIPLLITEFGGGIEYIGSADMTNPFIWYISPTVMRYHKYRSRAKNKPYVYINTSPNDNNMYDCWVFNAPFLKRITVVGVFKDERQLEEFNCKCGDEGSENFSFLNSEIKDRIVKRKIVYYRLLLPPPTINNQIPK